MSHKRKIEIRNLIGSRKLIYGLKKDIIKTLEHEAAVAERMKTYARSRSEYVHFDTLAESKRDSALILDVYLDQYRVL